MKRTQLIELLATIRSTFVSFFSILMFVALAVGVYLGIAWAAPALYTAINTDLEAENFHHYQLVFPYGITEESMEEIAAVEGVEDLEGAYVSVQRIKGDDASYTVRFQSLPERIDTLEVVEGELPRNARQVAVLDNFANKRDIEVGDSFTLTGNTDLDGLSDDVESLVVTAIVHAPEYLSTMESMYGQSGRGSGSLDGILYTVPAAFASEDFSGGFPVVNVRAAIGANLSCFTTAYRAESDVIQARLEEITPEMSSERFEEVKGEAQAEVDAVTEVLDESKQAVKDAKKQVEDGEKQLEELRKKIAEGEAKVAKGERELASGKARLAEGERQLAQAEAEFNRQKAAYQKKLDDAKAQLDEAKAALEFARESLDEAQARLEGYEAQVARAEQAVPNIIDILQKGIDDLAALDKSAEGWTDEAMVIIQRVQQEVPAEVEAAGITGYKLPEVIDPSEAEDIFQQFIDLLKQLVSEDNLTIHVVIPEADIDEDMRIGEVKEGIEEAKGYVSDYEAQYASSKAEYDKKKAEYDKAKAEFDKQVAYYQGLLDDARRKVEDGRAQVAEGECQLAAAKAQLEEAKRQLAEGEKELEEARSDIEDAEVGIAEMERAVVDAQTRVDDLQEMSISVLPRTANNGIASAAVLGKVTERLALSMAGLFVVVGLLVCYSAVSRIVHEQVALIGTKKALGLRSREITTSFMAYSVAAVIVGAIVGTIVGVLLVEGIINPALGGRFVLGSYAPYFEFPQFFAISGIELALILVSTWIACRSILKKQAVQLLRGPEPPKAKERFFEKWTIWKKLPLLTQTMINNVLNDKRRVFSTVVGVAGATALIVTAITLNDNVLASYDRHYETVYGYDSIAFVSEKNVGKAEAVLEDKGLPSAEVHVQTFAVDPMNGERDAARVYVPMDEEAFEALYNVDPTAGIGLDLSQDGVWVSHAFAEHQGAQVGDELVLDAGDGIKHRFEILGFYDFYLTSYEVIMSPHTYQLAMDEAPTTNALLIDTGLLGPKATEKALKADGGISSFVNDQKAQHQMFVSFSSISRTVVMVYLALAVLMAIVVLLNLNMMFIDEKKRELIVLMINGFSIKDAKRYISNDSIVLTILGIIAGVILGVVMGTVTVGSVEPQTAVFVKDIAWRAVAVGAIGSAVLSSIMGAIALRRIPRFKLTDINRM